MYLETLVWMLGLGLSIPVFDNRNLLMDSVLSSKFFLFNGIIVYWS